MSASLASCSSLGSLNCVVLWDLVVLAFVLNKTPGLWCEGLLDASLFLLSVSGTAVEDEAPKAFFYFLILLDE
eukprot:scaffold28417_cov56-Attheya_sp.AAC.2